jgi:ATP-dependent RNA helicase DDX20
MVCVHGVCFPVFYSWIYSSLPASKQMLAVSATYPEVLANALTRYMRDPTFVRLNPSDPSLIGVYRFYIISL